LWTPKRRSKKERSPGTPTARRILQELRALGERRNVEGMARFGIRAEIVYGVSKPRLDQMARRIGRDHDLAKELWASGVHDARLLGVLISEPLKVTAGQMERWARDFDNWDVCDGACCHLFAFAAPAWKKAVEWSSRKEQFVKRAGFALIAYLAYKDRTAPNSKFLRFLGIIRREACDDRHFVKKGVNWALRNIGKRNKALNRAAIRTARQLRGLDSAAARWIAADALRELTSPSVRRRLAKAGAQ